MPGIVISYRREDTGWITGRIFDRLETRFGKGHVFMDVDTIPEGVDFREYIKASLDQCDALIAVIGPHWIGARPNEKARIWDESDLVRIEIETALTKPIPVIPILIDRTQLPPSAELPETLRPLVFIQAARMDTQRDFNTHIERLIKRLVELMHHTKEVTKGTAWYSVISAPTIAQRKPRLSWGRNRLTALAFGLLVIAVPIFYWQQKVAAPSMTTKEQAPSAPPKPTDAGCLSWVVEKHGGLPRNPVVGGKEPAWPLYVCRTKVGQDTLPGKLIPGWACYVGLNGSELASHEYEALTGSNCPVMWVNAPSGVIPAHAFRGGMEAGQPVFVCRANHTVGTGGLQIGRSGWSTNHQCVISYGGSEYNYGTFEILTTED
jgi:Protein of unknown function (DUF3421)/TIR domain